MTCNNQATSLSPCSSPIVLLSVLELDSLDLGPDFRCPPVDLIDVFCPVRIVVAGGTLEERCRLQMPRVGDNSRVIQADPANRDLCNLKRVEAGHSRHFH